jgi:ribosome-binding factor A
MRNTRRTSRVGEMLRDALVEVLRHDVKDVDLGLASINEVEVSPDLHLARVYMSGFKEEETRNVVRALQQRAPRIRSLLGKRIRLRYTPELDFRYDDTSARAGRIESLLHEIQSNDDKHTDADDTDHDDQS